MTQVVIQPPVPSDVHGIRACSSLLRFPIHKLEPACAIRSCVRGLKPKHQRGASPVRQPIDRSVGWRIFDREAFRRRERAGANRREGPGCRIAQLRALARRRDTSGEGRKIHFARSRSHRPLAYYHVYRAKSSLGKSHGSAWRTEAITPAKVSHPVALIFFLPP